MRLGIRAALGALLCAFCAFGPVAWPATSTAWEVTGFTEFLKGRFSGLSLTAEGILTPGPSLEFKTALDQPAFWALALAPDHGIYAATGHQGKILRIGVDGSSKVLWAAEQSEVFAIAVDHSGTLYAGTSPNGGVYRIANGKAEQLWHSPAKYIWTIQCSKDGAFYVATGEPGRIYRIEASGKAGLYYDPGQSNVTSLAIGANDHLYAGSDPNGLLYDISGPGKATILFDSTLPEIRAIAVAPNGDIYAAGMGGAVSTRSPAAATTSSSSNVVVAATPTVITVTEAARGAARSDSEPALKPGADQAKTTASSPSSTPATSTAAVTEVSGVEKSAIYRIRPDGTVETLRSSKEDNVYDLFLDGDSLLFSTDDHGRIYQLKNGRTELMIEPGDGETTRLLKAGSLLYAAMSNPARLFAYSPAGAHAGFYESQVHDSVSVARWGHLQWYGATSSCGSGLAFRTRTGNAVRPDGTWSAWSAPISNPAEALIKSPSARFIQWRAEWAPGCSAELNTVDVPYLPQNAPPVIHSITVTSVVGTNAAKAAASNTNSSAYSVTVTDTGEPPAASPNGGATQNVSRLQTTQTQISWQADDPDGDKLVYSVYFRADDENGWQLIRSRMFENTLLLDPDVFADGRYFFRVVASDAPSNAAQYARETELISTPVLIDNTPPVVTLGQPQRTGDAIDIDLEAADKTSPLRLCEYSLDAGVWQPIEAVDGITDSQQERFHLHLDKLRPGEHLLVFRVYDAANNAGLARVILK